MDHATRVSLLIIGLMVALSLQIAIDIPGHDVPDVKDIAFLFPELN